MTSSKAILYVIGINILILAALILFFIYGVFYHGIMLVVFLYWTLDSYELFPWTKGKKLNPQQEKLRKQSRIFAPIGLVSSLLLILFY